MQSEDYKKRTAWDLNRILIFPVLLFVAALAGYLLFFADTKCAEQTHWKAIYLDGIVVAKYLDTTQHNYPAIKVRQFRNGDTIKEYLAEDRTKMHNLIAVSDTLYKAEKSLRLTIRRGYLVNDSVYRAYTIDTAIVYDCK